MPSDTSPVTVSSSGTVLATVDASSLFPRVRFSFRTRSGVHLSFRTVVASGALHLISDIDLSYTVVSSCAEGATSFTSSSLL